MKVYVVSRMCDDEYFCTEVVFVTADKKYAKEYCKKYNVKFEAWTGAILDTVTYKEYTLR